MSIQTSKVSGMGYSGGSWSHHWGGTQIKLILMAISWEKKRLEIEKLIWGGYFI